MWSDTMIDPNKLNTSNVSSTSSKKSLLQIAVPVSKVVPLKAFDKYTTNYKRIKTQAFYDLLHEMAADLHISPKHLLCYTGKVIIHKSSGEQFLWSRNLGQGLFLGMFSGGKTKFLNYF